MCVCVCVCVCRYMPVLMHQAKVLWERADYRELENLFSRTMDYCSDNETWKLNVAHVLFMQQDKYSEAARFYEPIVNSNYDSVCTPPRPAPPTRVSY